MHPSPDPSDSALDSAIVQRGLETFYSATVSGVRLQGSGFETDVYAFELEAALSIRGRVVRVYPKRAMAAKAAHEFAAIERLHAAGYPVPRALDLDGEGDALGPPFLVLERIARESLERS